MARKRETKPEPASQPPADLPAQPERFWCRGADAESLGEPPQPETRSLLRRLGPPPFPRSGFPLVGFLATVYEHVSKCAQEDHSSAAAVTNVGKNPRPLPVQYIHRDL
jgi:hypothetical protein